MSSKRMPLSHPGETLLQDFLEPLGITQYRLAKELRVPQTRIGEIVRGERSISPDTALRLSRFFGMSDGFWVNLQAHYDMEMEKDRLGNELTHIKRYVSTNAD
ncbi:MAG: HigA family addiction module antitoxin [Acidobacteriota bacterium]